MGNCNSIDGVGVTTMSNNKKQPAASETPRSTSRFVKKPPHIAKYGSHKYDYDWTLVKAAGEETYKKTTPG